MHIKFELKEYQTPDMRPVFPKSRIFQSFRAPSRYVGRDMAGNRFYEHPSSSDDPRRTKRTVQYNNPEDVWQYIGGGKRLPIQWSSWLTHTRPNAPTLEELQADMARQQRVLANVALIEARDRVERAEILRLETAALFDHGTKALPTPGAERKPLEEPQLATNEAPDPPRPQQKNPLPKMATDSFEPQTWTPRARTRVNDS